MAIYHGFSRFLCNPATFAISRAILPQLFNYLPQLSHFSAAIF